MLCHRIFKSGIFWNLVSFPEMKYLILRGQDCLTRPNFMIHWSCLLALLKIRNTLSISYRISRIILRLIGRIMLRFLSIKNHQVCVANSLRYLAIILGILFCPFKFVTVSHQWPLFYLVIVCDIWPLMTISLLSSYTTFLSFLHLFLPAWVARNKHLPMLYENMYS